MGLGTQDARKEELTEDWQRCWEELSMISKPVWRDPSRLEQVLTRAKQGDMAAL